MSTSWFRVGCTIGLSACRHEPASPPVAGCGGLQIVAGIVGSAGFGEDASPAADTWLFFPQDVTVAADGTWWIADYNNHVLREVDRDGIARVVVGSGFPAGGYGGPALDEPLDHPTMALPDPDDDGILWFAATGNHRIGRLDRGASWVEFPYGTGFQGFEGDGGPAVEAAFWRPSSLAFDDLGSMYISDRMNQVIRAIDSDGTVRTAVGTPGVAGYAGDDGPATEALLNAPAQTETDPGNRLDVRGARLVIADTGNDAVREVDLVSGTIRTLATGFSEPHDVAIGPDGTVYVADSANACVRAIDDEVRTVAGVCGEPGEPADGALAYPTGVDVDEHGVVWIADRDNHVIVRVCAP
jgi:hypothetical protein